MISHTQHNEIDKLYKYTPLTLIHDRAFARKIKVTSSKPTISKKASIEVFKTMKINPDNTRTIAEATELSRSLDWIDTNYFYKREKEDSEQGECSVPWRNYKCSRETQDSGGSCREQSYCSKGTVRLTICQQRKPKSQLTRVNTW